ncbi:MAG: hypothetical protein ACTSVE_00715 [Candidatus Helarchaeota archaeon]
MKSKKQSKTVSSNMVLLLISLCIIGSLSILFVTQIEIQPGWKYDEYTTSHATDVNVLAINDTNGDGYLDIITTLKATNEDYASNNIPQFGVVACLSGKTGIPIWKNELKGPALNAFPLLDVNGDGISEILISYATVDKDWTASNELNITANMFGNQIINGKNGESISLVDGVDSCNFTHRNVVDCVSFSNISDDQEDFIVIQNNNSYFNLPNTMTNITGYFVNGTIKKYYNTSDSYQFIDLLPYKNDNQLLALGANVVYLRNLSSPTPYDQIYKQVLISYNLNCYLVLQDLTGDNISEIAIGTDNGHLLVLNGSDGVIIHDISLGYYIQQLSSVTNQHGTIFSEIIASCYSSNGKTSSYLVSIDQVDYNISNPIIADSNLISLNCDMSGDLYPELAIMDRVQPFGAPGDVARIKILNGKTFQELLELNFQGGGRFLHNVRIDINVDGYYDFILTDSSSVTLASTNKPIGIWLSQSTIFIGMPIFIISLVALLVGGIRLSIALIRKEFDIQLKENIKKFKKSTVLNILIIVIMFILFLIFNLSMNVFNSTLILGDPITLTIIVDFSVFILWFALLPLTAAIFNKIAIKGSLFFIKLRDFLFKFSKKSDHEILVIDLTDRKSISSFQVAKRIILPTLLSLSIGLFVYTWFAPVLGFPQGFINLGGADFFQFMAGYMLLAIIPMILTFIIASFFLSSSWLLDDAGIVYYHDFHDDHIPGDIERLSIWLTSMISGIAGFSSVLTFISFVARIDLSSFASIDDPLIRLMAAFGTFTIFYVFPFLTSICYMLFSINVMETSLEQNKKKLYKIMQDAGYDITPRNLRNLGPLITRKSKNQ